MEPQFLVLSPASLLHKFLNHSMFWLSQFVGHRWSYPARPHFLTCTAGFAKRSAAIAGT